VFFFFFFARKTQQSKSSSSETVFPNTGHPVPSFQNIEEEGSSFLSYAGLADVIAQLIAACVKAVNC